MGQKQLSLEKGPLRGAQWELPAVSSASSANACTFWEVWCPPLASHLATIDRMNEKVSAINFSWDHWISQSVSSKSKSFG